MSTAYYTPPEVAKRLRISCEKVIGLLLAGELKGYNLASKSSSRPRYRISETDLADFLNRRSASVLPTSTPRRRRKPDAGIRQYY